MTPSVEIVYVHVPGTLEFYNYADRYVRSFLLFRPGVKHTHTIVYNGASRDRSALRLFNLLPDVRILQHDNSGWDIGSYLGASRCSDADMLICFGSNIHFYRGGWLDRMVKVWEKHGPGLYGTSASFEISPHINTTGFCCSPQMLAEYPYPINTKQDRYNFEHGHSGRSMGIMDTDTNIHMTFWKRLHRAGFPVMLITWDGEWEWWDWRTPKNIFRRGDQSNMLFHWKHSDGWAPLGSEEKMISSICTDLLTDPCFYLDEKRYANHRTCTTPEFLKNPREFYKNYMKQHGL